MRDVLELWSFRCQGCLQLIMDDARARKILTHGMVFRYHRECFDELPGFMQRWEVSDADILMVTGR